MSGRDSDSGSDNPYYTPAISRDGFAFGDGKFYAANDYYRHTRMDAKELYDLLTYIPPPVLTKKGTLTKRQPKVAQQECDAPFCAAQTAHYSLKPLKTKASAKKRPLAALEAGGEGVAECGQSAQTSPQEAATSSQTSQDFVWDL